MDKWLAVPDTYAAQKFLIRLQLKYHLLIDLLYQKLLIHRYDREAAIGRLLLIYLLICTHKQYFQESATFENVLYLNLALCFLLVQHFGVVQLKVSRDQMLL